MPRRNVLSSTPIRGSPNVSFRDTSLLPSSDSSYLANISTLRRQWQWAAFSQFFYTFAQLLQMPEVLLTDVEDDLARGTAVYLPRIMYRLLYTMSQDRKMTIDNWQPAFRKQCLKRNSTYNPLGPEPSRNATPEPDDLNEELNEFHNGRSDAAAISAAPSPARVDVEEKEEFDKPSVLPLSDDDGRKDQTLQASDTNIPEESDSKLDSPAESKNWVDLTMKQKLTALHMVTEWQFDNPHRLRQLMKDDGDSGLWRIEPIGYDAKTNAYWLIGPDRLWIQRALPKPPRAAKRKRPAPVKKAKPKPSTSKKEEVSESETEPTPSKRTRAGNIRASRTRAKEVEATPSGRSARAAKLKANKKLDAQAKELAEFQRQAALLSSTHKTSARQTRSSRVQTNSASSPAKTPILGTRASARLRGPAQDDEDDEWQQIPDEWLQDDADKHAARNIRRTRSKGKARAGPTEEPEDDAAQAGLGSDDASSELTELSDDQAEDAEETDVKPSIMEPPKVLASPRPKANGKVKKIEGEHTEQPDEPIEDTHNYIPKDFVEWETICITLSEWEAITERFANASHYQEKALHKILSQSIAPAVVAELKEVERKRKIEEAVVHRKRSSRIAIKESEKEEARLAAIRQAEEEEKLSRARRLEARAKKEEAEREKREYAREQRRIEREARERKIQSRNDPKEPQSSSPDPASATSSRGPSINGIVIPTPLQLNHKPAHNGSKSADWVLDCEICHKSGVNINDGSPMVSCGSCGRWQHITCHDFADRQAGYSKRNWDVQQFICQRCRSARVARMSNGHDRNLPMDQYSWSQSQSQRVSAQPSQSVNYLQPTSDLRYSQQQPIYDNRVVYSQQTPPPQQYPRSTAQPQATTHSRSQEITFSHYQPEQHVFSQNMGSSRWSGSYPSITSTSTRPQGTHQSTQFNEQVGYGPQITPPYQGSSSSSNPYGRAHDVRAFPRGHDLQAYTRVPDTQSYAQLPDEQLYSRPPPAPSHTSNGTWNHPSDSQYASPTSTQRSANHLSAAESLAFMQGSTSPVQGWSNTPYGEQPHANGIQHPVAATPPVQRHPSISNGHGPTYQFSTS